MNDLDLMRTMRADAPIPSRQRLDTGRERLLAAIESPAPRAVRAGRRFGGVRLMALAGGVAAVAVGVGVATQVGGHPATLHTSPAAARYDDPLVERAAFGWLPPGLDAMGYGADHQERDSFQVTAQKGKTRAGVTLTAYGRGKEPDLPHLPGGAPGRRIPAESINGHSAYWIFTPNASGQSTFELRWQYAPKRWADLTGNGLHGSSAELTRTAYKVARSATFGGTRPIALPLHVRGVPGGLTPKQTSLNNGAYGEVSADLAFLVDGPSSYLEVNVIKSNGTVGTTVPGKPGTPIVGLPRPNTKLDGHPVYLAPSFLYAYGVNGFDVHITATGSVLAKLDKTGGVAGLFHRTTVLGTDEANWTTNPVN